MLLFSIKNNDDKNKIRSLVIHQNGDIEFIIKKTNMMSSV